MNKNPIGKRLQIDKTNSRMVIVVALAAVLLVFAINAARVIIGEIGYTTKVLSAKDKAASQLEQNVSNSEKLINQYKVFADTSTNILGGSRNGAGLLDGSNDRLTLDALPSKYDFPGLISSIEKVLSSRAIRLEAIGGIDEEIVNSNAKAGANPEPVTMAFTFDATSSYQAVKSAIGDFQRSIRPFNITKLTLSGSNASMRISVEAETYFQSSKSLIIEKKEVK